MQNWVTVYTYRSNSHACMKFNKSPHIPHETVCPEARFTVTVQYVCYERANVASHGPANAGYDSDTGPLPRGPTGTSRLRWHQ